MNPKIACSASLYTIENQCTNIRCNKHINALPYVQDEHVFLSDMSVNCTKYTEEHNVIWVDGHRYIKI